MEMSVRAMESMAVALALSGWRWERASASNPIEVTVIFVVDGAFFMG
jgi:hypothetical protein